MFRWILTVCLALVVSWPGVSSAAEPRGLERIESALPADIRRQQDFDAADSAGLFVGVGSLADEHFAEVPYAVDDAVDLAYLFAVELSLMAPGGVTLALSGEPRKEETRERLRALTEAGARRRPAGWADIYDYLRESGQASGPHGVFVVSLATHGFNHEGQDYLVGSDSRRRFIRRSGIVVSEVLDEVSRSGSPRRLVLVDACRERLTRERAAGGGAEGQSAMGSAFAEAISKARGQVVLSATTLGGYSYDDVRRGNGVFTGAVLDGLRGGAGTDGRHFITAGTLAEYVNEQVLGWVVANRPEHVELSRGISRQIEGSMAQAPLAVDPGGIRDADVARQTAALEKLRGNQGDVLTGGMYDLVKGALEGRLRSSLRAELLAEVEALDGGELRQRSLAYWLSRHRGELLQGEPPPESGAEEEVPRRDPVETVARPEPAETVSRPEPEPQAEAEDLEASAALVESGLELARSEKRLIQLGLQAAGHDPGVVDGLVGAPDAGGVEEVAGLTGRDTDWLPERGIGEAVAGVRQQAGRGASGAPAAGLGEGAPGS